MGIFRPRCFDVAPGVKAVSARKWWRCRQIRDATVGESGRSKSALISLAQLECTSPVSTTRLDMPLSVMKFKSAPGWQGGTFP